MKNNTLEEIFRNDFDKLRNYVEGRVGNEGEDLVMEAFTRAYKYFPSFDPDKAALSTWFFRILLNVIQDHKEKMHPEVERIDFDAVPSSIQTDKSFDITQDVEEVLEAIEEEGELQKEALKLFLIEGYTAEEVKEMLGIKKGTLYQYVWRFKVKMKEKRNES